MSPGSRNSAPASAPQRRGEASPSATRGPLQGNRGPPAVLSHPGCVRSVPASPYPSRERCQLPDLAPLELPRLGGEVCRALFVSLRGLGGPPRSPRHLQGLAQAERTLTGALVFGDMAGGADAPPTPSVPRFSPAPATAPATACSSRALGQRRQRLPELETMLLRHPHAVPSNALQREDGRRERERKKKRANEQGGQSRSAAEPGGAGTAGWRRADWRREPRHDPPPSLPLPPPAEGPGSPGTAPTPAQPPHPLPFVFSEVGFWGSSSSRNPSGSKRLA